MKINQLMKMPHAFRKFYQTYGGIFPRTTDMLYSPIPNKKFQVSPLTKWIVRRFLRPDNSMGFKQRIINFFNNITKITRNRM